MTEIQAKTPKSALREQARQHARQIEAVRWLGVQDLALRWNVGDGTVRAIDRDKLPFLELGQSHIRRYDPRDVEAYEATAKRGESAA